MTCVDNKILYEADKKYISVTDLSDTSNVDTFTNLTTLNTLNTFTNFIKKLTFSNKDRIHLPMIKDLEDRKLKIIFYGEYRVLFIEGTWSHHDHYFLTFEPFEREREQYNIGIEPIIINTINSINTIIKRTYYLYYLGNIVTHDPLEIVDCIKHPLNTQRPVNVYSHNVMIANSIGDIYVADLYGLNFSIHRCIKKENNVKEQKTDYVCLTKVIYNACGYMHHKSIVDNEDRVFSLYRKNRCSKYLLVVRESDGSLYNVIYQKLDDKSLNNGLTIYLQESLTPFFLDILPDDDSQFIWNDILYDAVTNEIYLLKEKSKNKFLKPVKIQKT